MHAIDLTTLTHLEFTIHKRLQNATKHENGITITRAAQICDCSVSKISKFSKKLGFVNYKAYCRFLYGLPPLAEPTKTTELARLAHFIERLDPKLIAYFVDKLEGYGKILLFGYGPSAIFASYLEYKLKVITQKFVTTTNDETLAIKLLDSNTLIIVFSTTGSFASFVTLQSQAEANGALFLLVVEEYNTALIEQYPRVVFLTDSHQDHRLAPYEKSRAVFFIFFEEVISQLLIKRKASSDPK